MNQEELVDRVVIDNSGNIVGKCVNVENRDDDENLLIVQVKTKTKGEREVEIPMSTIQAIGKTIVLTVEIEGLIDNLEIIPFKEDLEDMELTNETDQNSQGTTDDQKWVIYRSIKTSK